ncbi:MAG: Ldh family oxidoreductase, partial [Halobacteriaceae archaeon]
GPLGRREVAELLAVHNRPSNAEGKKDGPDPPADSDEYTGVLQGSLALFVRPDLFTDPGRFEREMDEYARQVAELEPLAGFEESMLPGGPEARRERENREKGVPVGPDHRAELAALADEVGVAVPWS